VKVISIGMFVPGNQPVVWRGPMLHRALQQFLADVFWGDLDVLLLDLPPGTGDIAISICPAASPAPRSSSSPHRSRPLPRWPSGPAPSRLQTHQRVAGVIENMSLARASRRHRVRRSSGPVAARTVADSLTRLIGAPVPLLGQVPLDAGLREGGDSGTPIVLSDPDSPAAVVLRAVAKGLAQRSRGLSGRSLGVSPVKR
jgi:ATP-binding protein involved in chromosome partitioning